MATVLPFRFRAGGSGSVPPSPHHHRNTTKSSNKPFKSRFTTKSALRDLSKGRVENPEKGIRRTRHQQIMSKLDRKNQAKQKRQNDRHALEDRTNIFNPKIGAPRIVAVVPLHSKVSAAAAISSINASYRIYDEIPASGSGCVKVPAQRTSIRYISLPPENLFAILDACQVADYVIFVVSAEELVDDLGDLVLTAAKAQGISHFMMAAEGLLTVDPANRRPSVTQTLKAFMKQRFPEQDKIRCLDATRDCATIMQWICSKGPKGISWRDERSWMFVEDVKWSAENGIGSNEASNEVRITGIIRGQDLNSDRLVHVGDWGDYQIDRIVAKSSESSHTGKECMELDSSQERLLHEPTLDQDDLADLAPEEIAMEDVEVEATSTIASERRGVLLDDHHYFDEDVEDKPELPKRLPRGTSHYQSAWYLGDVSDSGSDVEDVNEITHSASLQDSERLPDSWEESMFEDHPMSDAGPSEYPHSEMLLEPSPDEEAEELAKYRAQKKQDAEDDSVFPDEVELRPDILARERLARYRGLRSLQTSHWETEEDKFYEPEEWARLLEIGNYKAAKNRFTKEALVNGVKPGTRVHIYLRNVPAAMQRLAKTAPPLTLFSLLRHEHKQTAVNFDITLNSTYPEHLKSKEELLLQCGPRRFVINPLFSQGGETPNDVHKFERFLHPGQSAVATFIGPVNWGAVPSLFFKRMGPVTPVGSGMERGTPSLSTSLPSSSEDLALVATGTSLAPSTTRVIAKRIILTGHPYKIHKKLVTVRYMFFNAEDVQWFKALQLWTRRGRTGHVKESLGTHGYFKAQFDAKINPMDAIAISLYKRMWPRRVRSWFPWGDGEMFKETNGDSEREQVGSGDRLGQ